LVGRSPGAKALPAAVKPTEINPEVDERDQQRATQKQDFDSEDGQIQ
jgi:hypothetical protein